MKIAKIRYLKSEISSEDFITIYGIKHTQKVVSDNGAMFIKNPL